MNLPGRKKGAMAYQFMAYQFLAYQFWDEGG